MVRDDNFSLHVASSFEHAFRIGITPLCWENLQFNVNAMLIGFEALKVDSFRLFTFRYDQVYFSNATGWAGRSKRFFGICSLHWYRFLLIHLRWLETQLKR